MTPEGKEEDDRVIWIDTDLIMALLLRCVLRPGGPSSGPHTLSKRLVASVCNTKRPISTIDCVSRTSNKLCSIQGMSSLFVKQCHRLALLKENLSSRKFFTTLSGRNAQYRSGQRAWEVDGAVVKSDTLIYSYKNDKYFRMITIFGIVQLFFWGNLAMFSYSGLSSVSEQSAQGKIDSETFWGKILTYQVKYRYRLAVFCMLVGYAVMFFTWMYPQRSIHKLTLLAGGHNLKVTTYTHLGKTREFVTPLSNLSSEQTRSIKQPTMSLKIKGHWFYYLLDKNNGVFHEPSLFDNVVNLKRKIK